MTFDAPVNVNYACTLVKLKTFVDLPNCDNVKAAIIFGNSVIVSKDVQVNTLGLFFPVECQLSHEFISQNNLYRKPELGNVDHEQKGFFEENRRIKALKFRGHKSEGFWLPLSSLSYLGNDVLTNLYGADENTTFDKIAGHEICRKYVIKHLHSNTSTNQPKSKVAKLEDSIVDNQFRLHFDTENLRRNVHKLNPSDFISISDKWHGTSVVIGKLLVKRKLNFFENLLQKLNLNINTTNYGLVYSSRKVIKSVNGLAKSSNHYYTEDIWGVVAKEVEDKIPNGFSIYGEIVGYTPAGSAIQKDYTYGCQHGFHKLLIYRVTNTTPDGLVLELPWLQMLQFAEKYGFQTVPTLYYGRAKDLYPGLDPANHWNDEFLAQLEKGFVNDGKCPHNNNQVPAEGIVVRVDTLNEAQSFKLKNFAFLQKESKDLDAGILDTESSESMELSEETSSV